MKRRHLSPEELAILKLRARTNLKAVTRQIILNHDWLNVIEDETLGFNARKNVLILLRKKTIAADQSVLSLEEKAILRKLPVDRTDLEKKQLERIIGGLKCFRRFPEAVKRRMAYCSYYVYIKAGRTILRQHHPPQGAYFILSGNVNVYIEVWNGFEKKFQQELKAEIGYGGMVGEVSLLHKIPRIGTSITTSHCELLVIYKGDFHQILRDVLDKQWREIEAALSCFSYFHDMDSYHVRECCIVSKIRTYDPMQTIYGDGSRHQGTVYFLVSGTVRWMEFLKVEVIHSGKEVYYKRFKDIEPHEVKEVPVVKETLRKSRNSAKLRMKMLKRSDNPPENNEKKSNINEPKSEADKKEVKAKKKVPKKKLPVGSPAPTKRKDIQKEVRTFFMQLALMSRGAVFGVGENITNRCVTSMNRVICLEIPRYWLMGYKPSYWFKVRHFLNSYVPNSEKVFEMFVENRKCMDKRKEYLNSILARKYHVCTTQINDVPFFIRMEEDLDFTK